MTKPGDQKPMGASSDGAGSEAATTVVDRVVRRERRRIRIYMVTALGFWALAVVGLVLRTYFISAFLVPKLLHRIQRASGAVEDTPQLVQEIHMVLLATVKESTLLVSGTVLAVIFAGVSSLILIVASRRATLREVSLGLRQISEQLAELRGRG